MKIIHCFRSPVGGIFRHVRDLLAEQTKAGHSVGFICDASTGGEYEDALFDKIRPSLALGLHRLPMARSISPRDLFTLVAIRNLIRKIGPDVVHSHSAKGGVYGRLGAAMASSAASSASHPIAAFYCPHGGAMHYDRASLKGKIFFAAERFLERYTDSLIFISGYEQNAYHEKVGTPRCPETVVYNGLPEAEFSAVGTSADAADFLYIGMMRDLKGPDVFIEAFRIAREKSGKNLTAMFVGDGEDKDRYISVIKTHGLSEAVSIHPAMPARVAFAQAKVVVVPSRAESLPYLVLEAMAAEKPIVSTDVGGIHEIFEAYRDRLVPSQDAEKLAQSMLNMLNDPAREADAKNMASHIKKRFSLDAMAMGMEATYLRAMGGR